MLPSLFSQGIREISVIERSNKSYIHKRELLRNEHDCRWRPEAFLSYIKGGNEEILRLYMSVNSRNFTKAIAEFKRRQIEADYSSRPDIFYLNMQKTFQHILMQPGQRESKYFLIDVDTKDIRTASAVETFIRENHTDCLFSYQTPHGIHFITKAFNPQQLKMENVMVIIDGLMLLYAEGKKTFDW